MDSENPFDMATEAVGDAAGAVKDLGGAAKEAATTAVVDVDPLSDKLAESGMSDVPFGSEDTPSVEAMASYDELAPPSYEDTVTFDAAPAEEETSLADPEPVKEAEPEMQGADATEVKTSERSSNFEITVSDPMKQPEKDSLIGSTFVSYKIESRTTLPEYKRKELVVRRRFKEFVALADRLRKSHRGYFIPPRPDKNVVEGKLHSTEFIEVRRVALQKYLQKLGKHPVLSRSRELQLFLEWEGDISSCGEWKEMENAGWKAGLTNLPKQLMGNESSIPTTDEAVSKRDGTNLIRGFKEFKQKFKNKTNMDDKAKLDMDPHEDLVEEKQKVKDLQVVLAEASSEAEFMIKRMEKVADAFGDFGLSAIKTSKFEEEEGNRDGKYSESGEHIREISAHLKSTGTQCVRMSRLVRSATENTAAQLSHIHDYLGLMPAALTALRERDQATLTYQTLCNEMTNKQQQVAKLEAKSAGKLGGDKGKTRKVHELQLDIEALEKAKKAAHEECERIAERNKEEVARFVVEKKADMATMLLGFAKVQAALWQRTADVWKAAAGEEEQDEEITTENPLAD
ncbi:sorting nexin 2a [Chloropicon primus]|uniref:Sorting nexin 2a n=1 Tax=Chloropicon primus TaxID=1764295 RepID=A0A5B8MB02_9CHLO|nr:sorting nexin 2a [Chloropicon primus]UPQ96764.1 sorting nexin 2a [Chloropicon primus]|mmetsp:Transcript_5542/g.16833  ORF Transcript_5542/g.16833 Transcript_5542/m.16833 type:complete len:570 (+) Transcript_5542:221-1930(+)|eukprot:QDZ17546.1 sorting nexin 2a [Chloropicon primus]